MIAYALAFTQVAVLASFIALIGLRSPERGEVDQPSSLRDELCDSIHELRALSRRLRRRCEKQPRRGTSRPR